MDSTGNLRQSLRMLRRDWRSGELRLLALALLLAVAAVASVGFLSDRVRQGLQRNAAQYLGADAVLESDHPIDAHWAERARRVGLREASSASFPSMAMADASSDASVLVGVKAVSQAYPLRGALQLEQGAARRTVESGPQAGTAWVDRGVLDSLGIEPGQRLRLGKTSLRIAGVIAVEPDRSVQVMGFAPRVLISDQDLAATGLIQPGSRVSYRWMVAGETSEVHALIAALKTGLQRGQRLESIEDARPEMQRNLDRAGRFLGLVALLTVLIAAVAVSSAARRFTARRLDACALLRCLGLHQMRMLRIFAIEFLLVGVLASVAGVLAGLVLHLVLLQLLAGMLQADVPAPSWVPALQGLLCGIVLVLGFALAPLEQLRRVSPLRVLRRDLGAPGMRMWGAYAAGLVAFSLLLLWTADDAKLGAIAGAGFLGCIAVFALAARGLLALLQLGRRGAGNRGGMALRFALAALQRRPGSSVAQLVTLALGLMALLVLAIVRTDLVDQWRDKSPPDAPNRFVINIQPDQAQLVIARLHAARIEDVALEPMVRGRLIAIDGRPVGSKDYDDERARALIDREFNLSYRAQAPAHNRIEQGRWFAADAPELSIEEGIAQRLGIRMGQSLRFDVAGQTVEATVTSVRKVDWDSMRVNFFVIMAPALLREAPQSLITSFRLPPQQAALMGELVRQFPNLTVIDTGLVMAQLRAMLDQLIAAAQFLFAFALAAGILVLYMAVLSAHDERMREAALLRALGASRRQLAGAQLAEMLLVGTSGGILAALGAGATAWCLAHFVFDFEYAVHAWVPLAGICGGVAAAVLGGWSGARGILRSPPLASLRDA